MGFLGSLLGVKKDQAVNAAMDYIVSWDPEAASEAEIRDMDQRLDAIGKTMATAKVRLDKEVQEADQIKALKDQRLKAAEILQEKYEAATSDAEKASLNDSLTKLVDLIEKMQPDVEREIQDVVEAQEFFDQIKTNFETLGAKLKSAKATLDRAKRDMALSAQRREVAEQRASMAKEAAGVGSVHSSMDVALTAMNRVVEANKVATEAAKAKADLFKVSEPEKEDPNVKAALEAAEGKSTSTLSASDRLKALRSKG